MAELPGEVQQSIDDLEGKLNELDKLLQPVFDVDFQSLLQTLSPHEQAKLHITMAYALNTLFYSTLTLSHLQSVVYLRTQGHSPAEHPVSSEVV
jgi:hypothetical protein